MHDPANTRSNAAAIGLLLGFILAAAFFFLMLTDPDLHTPHRRPNHGLGLGVPSQQKYIDSEAEFERECEHFSYVLDRCMTPRATAGYSVARNPSTVAILR